MSSTIEVIEDATTLSISEQVAVIEVADDTGNLIETPVAQGPRGKEGAIGPPGPAGGETFPWHQQIALDVWTVPHNLQRYPTVVVTDEAGEQLLADVKYIDLNIIQITHGRPLVGYAYCN